VKTIQVKKTNSMVWSCEFEESPIIIVEEIYTEFTSKHVVTLMMKAFG